MSIVHKIHFTSLYFRIMGKIKGSYGRFPTHPVRQIYRLKKEGKSQSQIANLLGISRGRVRSAPANRIGNTNSRQVGKVGRPRAKTRRQDAHLSVSTKVNRFHSNRQLASRFPVGINEHTMLSREHPPILLGTSKSVPRSTSINSGQMRKNPFSYRPFGFFQMNHRSI